MATVWKNLADGLPTFGKRVLLKWSHLNHIEDGALYESEVVPGKWSHALFDGESLNGNYILNLLGNDNVGTRVVMPKPKMDELEKEFWRGASVALGLLAGACREGSMAADIMREIGATPEIFKQSGADRYDLDPLRKAWKTEYETRKHVTPR